MVTTVREVPAFPAAVFATVPDESTYEIRRIEGTIPAGLSGTTYWNGPARFGIGPGRARHWLDGDGMITALHMQAGAIRFTNKFVRTRKWNEETSAGRPVFRCFATAFRGDRLLRGIGLESPANISVVPFDSVLLAFGEQGLPWRIDPYSLDTQGQYSFGGTINEVTPFAAHAKLDTDSGALVNFGVSFDPRRPSVTLYDFAPDGALVSRRCIPLEQPSSIHDFVLTPRSAIFYVSPYIVDVRSLVRGGTLLDALTWRPEFGSRIVVVDRASGSARTIRIAGRYCLHTINAFEADGLLFLDVVEMDRPVYDQYFLETLLDDAPAGRAVRFVLDPAAECVVARIEMDYDRAPDFPSIPPQSSGRPYGWFAALGLSAGGARGRKLYDELVLTRWDSSRPPEVYRTPAGVFFSGEPVVVPGGRPDGHVIICPVLDARNSRSAITLFDAEAIRTGPFATIPLEAPLPPAFHGVWVGASAHA